MTKIKIMDQILANKIAAGEVVEKCASVVKELVENAIDAESSEIKIVLKEAGIKEIKVIDNGVGMDAEDAKLAFSRHATSKILEEDDLYQINSLGFRGEALASIASVSKIELITASDDVGTKVLVEGGKIKSVSKIGARQGTEIKINDLFYNTPARLKYLKNIYTELANVTNFVNKIALANPQIKFTLINNQKTLLKTDGSGDLLKVIMQVYGKEVTENMLYITGENADYEVSGYISKPNIYRTNRNHMITIVNGRVVRNQEINKIINEAYYTYKPDNQHPIVVINIQVDPVLIDVNIHPTKQDIKFSKDKELKLLLKSLISQVLEKKPVIPKVQDNYKQQAFDFTVDEEVEEKPVIKNESETIDSDISEKEKLPYLEVVASLFGTYIIGQNELGMYLIDQHAANERINYEKIKQKLKNNSYDKTNFLVPLTIEFTNDEFIILKENFNLLKEYGLLVEEFGLNSVIIKEYPTWLPDNYEEKAIKKLLEIIIAKEKEFDLEKFNEKIAINLSCKLAIKANESISISEMEQLIKDLRNCQNPTTCPHGRPTIIFYEKYELEKMFKRSGF